MLISPTLILSSPILPTALASLFDNCHIIGGEDGTNYHVEDGNNRGFFLCDHEENVCDLVLFEIRHGGFIWQLKSFGVDSDGSPLPYVFKILKYVSTALWKNIQSGELAPAEQILWKSVVLNQKIFNIATDMMFDPENFDLSLISTGDYAYIVDRNGRYPEQNFYKNDTLSSPCRKLWYQNKPYVR